MVVIEWFGISEYIYINKSCLFLFFEVKYFKELVLELKFY